MRNKVVAFTIFLACLISQPPAAWSDENAATSGPPEKGRGEWLVGILKQLANNGNLTDATWVGRTLQIKFKLTGDLLARTAGGECAASETYAPLSVANYLPEDSGWFRPTAEGVPYAVRPGGTSALPTQASEGLKDMTPPSPKMEYEIKKGECRGATKVADRSSAILFFNQLQVFACITEPDLKKFLPGVRQELGLDGSVPYSYLGRRNPDAGTRIGFEFWGAPCLSEVRVEEAWRYGLSP